MKILVVDDSTAMRRIIVRAVQHADVGEHTFLQAADGFEAFTLVAAEAPGLVLADWTMSGVDGMDLLQALRANGNAVPFGFITAQASEARRSEALRAGAQFLIGKPFTAQTLGAAVARYADG